MQVTFAGVGSAFTTTDYYQSNMVITSRSGKRMLIDCGSDSRFALGELGATNQNIGTWADAIYISHLHADHIGGLEWLGFCTQFAPPPSKHLTMFLVNTLVRPLWRSLRSGLESIEGRVCNLNSYFDVHPVGINDDFVWEGIRFRPIQTVHVMNGRGIVPSFGLLINEVEDPQKTWFLTTDTQFCPRQIERFYDQSDVIFQDAETGPFKSGVHAHYDDLKTLPASTKKKMWLYHYQPNPQQDPRADGFAGFIHKGQVFDSGSSIGELIHDRLL